MIFSDLVVDFKKFEKTRCALTRAKKIDVTTWGAFESVIVFQNKNAQKFATNLFDRKVLDLWNATFI